MHVLARPRAHASCVHTCVRPSARPGVWPAKASLIPNLAASLVIASLAHGYAHDLVPTGSPWFCPLHGHLWLFRFGVLDQVERSDGVLWLASMPVTACGGSCRCSKPTDQRVVSCGELARVGTLIRPDEVLSYDELVVLCPCLNPSMQNCKGVRRVVMISPWFYVL